jgi:hypothetical protein
MAVLKATARKAIPKKAFGLPSKAATPKAKAKSGNYPIPDKAHAANAKARARQQLNKGNLSSSAYSQIVAKANRKLGKS